MNSFKLLSLLQLVLWLIVANSVAHDNETNEVHAQDFKLLKEGHRIRKFKDYYIKPGTTAAQILRDRGYLAKEYHFKTVDGYILTIVRGTNPLINEGKHGLGHKDPILFIHGSLSSAPIWVLNSKGARPQDWTSLKVNNLKLRELNELIGHYDSARSMPMLAMNFGYEVWLLNRRGMSQSEGRAGHLNRTWAQLASAVPKSFVAGGYSLDILFQQFVQAKPREIRHKVIVDKLERTKNLKERQNLLLDFWAEAFDDAKAFVDVPESLAGFGDFKKMLMHTFDPDYWNFSFDEQAQYDFPQAIKFVLHKTGKKRLHVFTHSAAASMSLMSLATYPHLAKKINKMFNWGSCVNTGTKTDIFLLISKLHPIIQSYVGPIPMAFTILQIQSMLQNLCNDEVKQRTICEVTNDLLLGPSKGQSPITQYLLSNVLQPTSSHEIQHFFQMAHSKRPHHYKFNKPEDNLARYGQLEPPPYDFSRIKLRNMVFHTGTDDVLSSPDMLKATMGQLSVPYKLLIVNETGIHFNHLAVFSHEQTTRLTNLPMLIDLERPENERQQGQSVVVNSLDSH